MKYHTYLKQLEETPAHPLWEWPSLLPFLISSCPTLLQLRVTQKKARPSRIPAANDLLFFGCCDVLCCCFSNPDPLATNPCLYRLVSQSPEVRLELTKLPFPLLPSKIRLCEKERTTRQKSWYDGWRVRSGEKKNDDRETETLNATRCVCCNDTGGEKVERSKCWMLRANGDGCVSVWLTSPLPLREVIVVGVCVCDWLLARPPLGMHYLRFWYLESEVMTFWLQQIARVNRIMHR